MVAHASVQHPGFWERLGFLIERFLRMQEIGARATGPHNEGASMLTQMRPLTEAEHAESELIRLDSAVRHLSWGEPVSRWYGDRYIVRLKQATPELRARALEEHGFTEADYEGWLERYDEPPFPH